MHVFPGAAAILSGIWHPKLGAYVSPATHHSPGQSPSFLLSLASLFLPPLPVTALQHQLRTQAHSHEGVLSIASPL